MTTCGACGEALPEDARFCPACGAAAEQPQPVGEERKLATVLFADLVGSTALADREDPERVRARLDRFYDAMSEEIERTGGTVEKFAGDAVMAVFGAPAALEDHAERALHAALAMRRRLADLSPDLDLRIGVNTGDVVVGAPREGSGLVAGDAVNVGARLEQAAAPGEVLAGERTVALARGAFEFGESRTIEAKGKPSGVVSRAVLRALSLARPRGARGFRRAFVGRDGELELLRATFRRAAASDEPHLVTIVGEPGVGKTRLVRELWELLGDEEAPPMRRTGRCLPYGDGITYWPLGEVVKEHFGILDSDSPQEATRRLGGDEILGLAIGLDVAGGVHPADARERLHAAAVRFFESQAAERPVVNLVEDIHWAEADLLDLLERIVKDARAPLLVVATTRPELLDRRPAWGAGRRNATTIWLEPLAAAATSRLLDELLTVALPGDVRALVVERAEGNPFFVEELLGSLVDDGVLEHTDGTWRVYELPEGFSVPDSVQAVLAARMDRLPATEKAALQAASVVGRAFWPGAVTHLLDGEIPDLALLEERDFIRRSSGSSMAGEREYAIKHALTREVAYASIPKSRRGRLHAMLARWIEAGSSKDEHASLLAYHYLQAVDPADADLAWGDAPQELERVRREAVHWLRRAGELARSRSEMVEAIELYTRASELTEDAHERALLWREIGLAHALRYDGESFWAAMQEALDGPLAPEEEADVYSILAFQTSIRSGMWATRPDPVVTRSWGEAALARGASVQKIRARALLTFANIDPVGRESDALEAMALADELRDPELRSYSLSALGYSASAEHRYDEAMALLERRLALLPEISDPDHITEAYESAAPTLTAVARFDDARALTAKHQELSARLSPHHRLHGIAIEFELEDAAGGWQAMVDREPALLDAVEANLATPCIRNARCLLLTAVARLVVGDDERSRTFVRRAAALEGSGHEESLAAPRLRLALLSGDRPAVERLVRMDLWHRARVYGPGSVAPLLDGLCTLRDRERIEAVAPPLVVAGTVLEPFALRALGAARGDDGFLASADERFASLGLEWHRAQTERLLGGL